MVMYCAGADPYYEPFLANPVEVALAMVQRNCVVPMQVCHHFAGPMARAARAASCSCRRAPGSSGPNMVAYSRDEGLRHGDGEALWAELHGRVSTSWGWCWA